MNVTDEGNMYAYYIFIDNSQPNAKNSIEIRNITKTECTKIAHKVLIINMEDSDCLHQYLYRIKLG